MLQSLILVGLIMGSIYGLVGLGYSIIYRASGIMNLAQGEMITLAAFLGYTLYAVLKLPYWAALCLTLIIMFGFGYLLQVLLIGPYQKLGVKGIMIILCTFSASNIMNSGCNLIWDANSKGFPSIFSKTTVQIMGAYLPPEKIMCFFLALASMLGMHLFMTRTKMGIGMRACSMDSMAAEACGIDVRKSQCLTWALASTVSGICGMLLGPIYGVSLTLGAMISPKGFASSVAGGFGNMYGAMIGGILVGLAESLVSGYVGSTWKDMVAYLLLFLILIVRPTGILNDQAVRDV